MWYNIFNNWYLFQYGRKNFQSLLSTVKYLPYSIIKLLFNIPHPDNWKKKSLWWSFVLCHQTFPLIALFIQNASNTLKIRQRYKRITSSFAQEVQQGSEYEHSGILERLWFYIIHKADICFWMRKAKPDIQLLTSSPEYMKHGLSR